MPDNKPPQKPAPPPAKGTGTGTSPTPSKVPAGGTAPQSVDKPPQTR